uniref:MFS domain-containing protein n=1 Tax=Parastrongyloides trichosuri TaxID=131310 RepID=A0A0N4Z7M3_PARTI
MHDATFAIGCQKFNLTSSQIGMLFLCIGGLYAIFAPIWGCIIDKCDISGYFFNVGYFLITISFAIMGPLPFFNYKPTIPLYAVSLSLVGLGCSMLFVPVFKQCMNIVVKEHHYSDNIQTLSIISGVFGSAFCIGAFLGPLIGSGLVSGNTTSFKSFTLKQWIVLIVLIVTNIVSPMAFACISPFFVTVAESKGMTITENGIVFAVFDLLGFLLSPFVGKMITKFGIKAIFTSGIAFLSLGTLIFSLTNSITSGTWFFISTLILRIIQSIGNAMILTTTYAIAANDFPDSMSSVLGLVETGAGIGYTSGSVLGGFLYQYLGYASPFLVLGGICFITGIISFFYISPKNKNDESDKNNENEESLTFIEAIKIKDLWCILYTLSVSGFILGMEDSTFAIGCKQFNLKSSQIGLLLLCLGGLYAIFAPIWGFLIDKWPISEYLFIGGYILTTVGFSIMGPLPFLNYKPSIPLYGISLAILGLACSMMFVPAFKQCMDIAIKEHHFADNLQTSSIISGAFSSSLSLGAFLGPLIGSIIVNNVGYGNTLSIMALINFISVCFCDKKCNHNF